MASMLVTGSAGFIGSQTALRLLADGHQVLGLDNINTYYDRTLKEARLSRLCDNNDFRFLLGDLTDREFMEGVFANHQFDVVIHLAAQAGVRYSLENPHVYVDSNVTGFLNILEGCRRRQIGHLVYASSSSVYGANRNMPFTTADRVHRPVSLYAATKRANELMAHTYSYLYGIPMTGLRLFTVYGPWGRPDMAAFLFTDAVLRDKPIKVFNEGKMKRDFTYIDDAVEGIVRIAARPPAAGASSEGTAGVAPDRDAEFPDAPCRVYNLGNGRPESLGDFISVIERCCGKVAIREMYPMQAGDVESTYADIEPLAAATGFRPQVPIEVGLERYVAWHREYYGL